MIARRLHGEQSTNPPKQPNRYLTWINNYVADDYVQAVEKGCGTSQTLKQFNAPTLIWNLALVEKHATKQSPSRIEELVTIFIHATKVSS